MLTLNPKHKVAEGIAPPKKEHAFDLGSEILQDIVECKARTWTEGNKVPSTKMNNCAEALIYFYATPDTYWKRFLVERSERKTNGETLLSYFIRTPSHMTPSDVEFWELDGVTGDTFKHLPDSRKGYT